MMTFAEKVEKLCRAWNGSVTSWGRTPEHNALVGGVHNSKHIDWVAVDVVLDHQGGVAPFIDACNDVGLRAFWDKDHVHVQEP